MPTIASPGKNEPMKAESQAFEAVIVGAKPLRRITKMSKVEQCPTCGARCKTKVDKESGKVHYEALQDEDAFKKIELLKKQIM